MLKARGFGCGEKKWEEDLTFFSFYFLPVSQQQQENEDASTILGDKLQQKMDSVTFTQERMKRQLDDLQDKVQVSPTELFNYQGTHFQENLNQRLLLVFLRTSIKTSLETCNIRDTAKGMFLEVR